MGLQSAMTTSLTGLTGAETMIDVAGNNIANANTVGFKESSVSFATQFLQTYSVGSAPTGTSGGTNPRQVGLGVQVAEITPDFTQGTIEISSNPLDLAIQGDGFFIVEGSQGEQLYTRNGQFKTNADNEIVTITGQRVLGYTVDDNYNIIPELAPLEIPLGAAAVAQATENVAIIGDLDPNAVVGSVPQVIQSAILSDGRREVPDGGAVDLTALSRPPVDSSTAAPTGAAGNVAAGNYEYRVAFVDAYGNEGPASTEIDAVVLNPNETVQINGIPIASAPPGATQMRIYRRNTTGGPEFHAITAAPVALALSSTDAASDATIATNDVLDDSVLNNGSYSYYVTFVNPSGEETRPTALLGPRSADSTNTPRIYLEDLPRPSIDPDTGGYNGIRIYRNLANDPSSFHRVGEIDATTISTLFSSSPIVFMDSASDASISGNPLVNLDGPEISFDTPLVELVQRDGANYVNLFEAGELSFTADKGEIDLATRTFTITADTTVVDLLDFMEDTMGIVQTAAEDTFPSTAAGGTVTGSRLQFTSNMGEENALGIDLTAFELTPAAGGTTNAVPLRFASTGEDANGAGATVNMTVYDSLGSPLRVRVTTVVENRSEAGAVFRWIATSGDHIPETGASTVVGTGTFTTGSDGRLLSTSEDRISIDRGTSPAESPLEIQLDFSQISALANNGNELNQGETDGSPAGTLTSFIITDSGNIQGIFSNGGIRELGQIRMALFSNNGGLEQLGQNMFRQGINSGLPIYGDPGSQGIGSVKAGSVELSNSDIGQNLIKLILASTQYRGSARVITAAQELLDELLALRR